MLVLSRSVSKKSALRPTLITRLRTSIRQDSVRSMASHSSSPDEPLPNLWQTLALAWNQGRGSSDGFQSYATATHKFLLTQGFMYSLLGLLSVVFPALVADVMLIPSPPAHDLAWFRILGVAMTVIGYFYIQAARQVDIAPCVIHTTFNRVTFVPALLLYALFLGSVPQVCTALGVIDPILALLTHYVWVHDKQKKK